jgi:regulation of enolase protein 1 (concanavalin A-like superfamily)
MSHLTLKGTDIGKPVKQGSTEAYSDGYLLTAGGTDIWDTSDQFHFAYAAHADDFDFSVRLESLSSADLYTKAGIMARDTLEADSPHIYHMVFPDNSTRNKNNGGYELQFREKSGGDSAAIYPSDYTSETPEFPVFFPETWIRLKRSGDSFEAFCRTGEEEWKLFAAQDLKLNTTIQLGLAVTAHHNDETVLAFFKDLTLL